jgi:hypothetical protein
VEEGRGREERRKQHTPASLVVRSFGGRGVDMMLAGLELRMRFQMARLLGLRV